MAEFVPVEPFDIVIFGVTGDLSRQKLLPALFHRYCDGQIDDSSRIIGVARGAMQGDAFLDLVRDKVAAPQPTVSRKIKVKFAALLDYFDIDATDEQADWDSVKGALSSDPRPRIFYLAVAPRLYVPICEALGKAGLKNAGARVVLKNPLGRICKALMRLIKGSARFLTSIIFSAWTIISAKRRCKIC